MQDFQLKLELEGGTAIIGMKGELTHAGEARLLTAYDKVEAAQCTNLVLDFSDIEYINSAGMSIIITLLTKSQKFDQHVCACGLSSHFQKIFDMVGLTRYIPHYNSRSNAIASLA